MRKVILLAGYPATGKTYMSKIIKECIPTAMYIAQDEFKELLYDKVGFNDIMEKNQLVEEARILFYNTVDQSLQHNQVLILDYPFSTKQFSFLNELKEKYEADFLTIRLVGDLDVLYDRRIERDLVPERNKGHILDCYHGYESYSRDNYPLSREEYKASCINGKYNQFQYGQLIEVDVTDYSQINYDQIKVEVKQYIYGENYGTN